MKSLVKSEVKKTFRRIDAKVLLLLGLWPLMLGIFVTIWPDVFKASGSNLGAFEFSNYMIMMQNEIYLPVLVAVVIASISFYQEIHKKTIYFYKDLPRKRILNSKYLSVYSVYFVFLLIYAIMAYISYYVAFRHHSLATGTFIAVPEMEAIVDQFYQDIQMVLGAAFYIHVGIVLAIRTSTGMSIFGTTLFYMFVKISPHLKVFKFIIPIGYREVVKFSSHPYLFSMALSLVVYAIYHGLLYYINRKTFEKMQFN